MCVHLKKYSLKVKGEKRITPNSSSNRSSRATTMLRCVCDLCVGVCVKYSLLFFSLSLFLFWWYLACRFALSLSRAGREIRIWFGSGASATVTVLVCLFAHTNASKISISSSISSIHNVHTHTPHYFSVCVFVPFCKRSFYCIYMHAYGVHSVAMSFVWSI